MVWLHFPYTNKKLLVWCDITSTFILARYILEVVTAAGLQMYTVASTRYLVMFINYVIPNLQLRKALSDVVWTQYHIPQHVGPSLKRF